MTRTDESVLASIAAVLGAPGERISMRDHAALRRMDPLDPAAAAMVVYRLLHEREMPLQGHRLTQRWTVLVHALALSRGAHDPAVPIGRALWGMRYTEQRINQLLGADFDNLSQLVPRLARRLHSSGSRMDFAPLMRLVLAAGRNEERAGRARLEIARSCARHQSEQ